MKTYELYNLTTGEILADNLTFEEVPELFEAYANFFPEDEIVACYRENKMVRAQARVINRDEMARNKFMVEWFDLMEEIMSMGNIN